MKKWLVKYRFQKGRNNKKHKKCVICESEFLSNGPTKHCSIKCMLLLRKTVNHRGCWIWPGKKGKYGHGVTSHSKLVHRLSYEAFKGPIPEKIFVCHVCDDGSCYNPDHLFLGTQTDNMRDCAKKGRRTPCKGSKNGKAKLSEYDVLQIREKSAKGMTNTEIAKEYHVGDGWISQIVHRKKWRHL